MSKLFISHSSQDDDFVRELRAALADHGQAGWIDSRELRGGNPLWPEIQRAIEAALAATGGNKVAAAKLLGISRATLYERLESIA